MATDPAPTDDARQLLAALQQAHAGKARRIDLATIWRCFRAEVRGYTGHTEARPYLARLLQQLEGRAALTLPQTSSSWDCSAEPRLPSFVTLASAGPKRQPAKQVAAIAWPPELAFAREPGLARYRRELLAVREFLAKGGRTQTLVPVRERSLQLFGDEKRLDQLLRSQLFAEGRLSLSTLRCHAVAPPLVYEAAADVRACRAGLLVLENLHTYDSFRRWNRGAGVYRAIVYGHGDEFKASCLDLPRICGELETDEVEYFGDLDIRGLQILGYARAQLVDASLVVRATAGWYRRLLDYPRQTVGKMRPEVDLAALVAETMPEMLRAAVLDLLSSGQRIPQEWIGTEVLVAGGGDEV